MTKEKEHIVNMFLCCSPLIIRQRSAILLQLHTGFASVDDWVTLGGMTFYNIEIAEKERNSPGKQGLVDDPNEDFNCEKPEMKHKIK